MKIISIPMKNELSKEAARLISYGSEEIVGYSVNHNILQLQVTDNADVSVIEDNIHELLNDVQGEQDEEIIYSNVLQQKFYSDEEIKNGEIIHFDDNGMVVLSETGLKLYEFFDKYFLSILSDMKVSYMKFPTLLKLDTLCDTNYMNTSPQHILLCSKVTEALHKYKELSKKYMSGEMKEIINEPMFSLSPSACFHVYQYLRNKCLDENSIFSLRQNVFRNEGHLNWTELGRLQDYNIREIVMIGNRDYVIDMRKILLSKVERLLNELGISYYVNIAADPFVMPIMQRFGKNQRLNRVKYELRLMIGKNASLACASFNIHGITFSSKFDFRVLGCENTESGCIGFGLERLIIAFLHQYGNNYDQWPEIVRENL